MKTAPNTTDLLPCPFCGRSAEHSEMNFEALKKVCADFHLVSCTNLICPSVAAAVGEDEEEATQHWNERHATANGKDERGVLPCPFCGEHPKNIGKFKGVNEEFALYHVTCHCAVRPWSSGTTQQQAIDRWNTRI